MILIIICKSDTGHKQDRDHIDEDHADTGKRQKSDMKLFIKKRLHILTEGVDVLPILFKKLESVYRLHIADIQ